MPDLSCAWCPTVSPYVGAPGSGYSSDLLMDCLLWRARPLWVTPCDLQDASYGIWQCFLAVAVLSLRLLLCCRFMWLCLIIVASPKPWPRCCMMSSISCPACMILTVQPAVQLGLQGQSNRQRHKLCWDSHCCYYEYIHTLAYGSLCQLVCAVARPQYSSLGSNHI